MYTLYGSRGSGSDAVEMVLIELGQPYKFVAVDGEARKAPDFVRISPLGRVPALGLPDGSSMFESAAMLIHLTTTHPSDLAPAIGTPAHARYLQWMVYLSANVYETELRTFYSDRYTTGGAAAAAAVKEQADRDMMQLYEIIERQLSPGLLGDKISAADLYLTMLTTWHLPAPAELYRRFPKIGALATRIRGRQSSHTVLGAAA